MDIFQESDQVNQETQKEIVSLEGDINIIIETKRKGGTKPESKKIVL